MGRHRRASSLEATSSPEYRGAAVAAQCFTSVCPIDQTIRWAAPAYLRALFTILARRRRPLVGCGVMGQCWAFWHNLCKTEYVAATHAAPFVWNASAWAGTEKRHMSGPATEEATAEGPVNS